MTSNDKAFLALAVFVVTAVCTTILWITLANNAAQQGNLRLCLASGGAFVPGTSGQSSYHEPMECRK